MFRNFKFFRAPATGARKDPPMPDPTPTPPPTTAPTPPPINLSQQGSAQITALTDAMRQLAQSQKTLLEAMKPEPTPVPQPAPAPSGTISGDPTGGSSPAVLGAIDYSRLSPLQQITLGLRQGAD